MRPVSETPLLPGRFLLLIVPRGAVSLTGMAAYSLRWLTRNAEAPRPFENAFGPATAIGRVLDGIPLRDQVFLEFVLES